MSGTPITINEEYLAQLCAAVAEKAAKAAAEAAATAAYQAGFQAGSSSAAAQPTSGKGRGKGTRQKKEKVTDTYELDQTRTIDMDPRDPRALGEGPCGLEHTGKQTGNQWARWTECSRCCLRLEYTPYKHSPTTSTRTENPKDVRDAMRELSEAHIWENMEAKQMQQKIKEIQARKAQHRPVRGAKAKAKARSGPTRYNMTEGDETAPTEETPMEKYTAQDWVDWETVAAEAPASDL